MRQYNYKCNAIVIHFKSNFKDEDCMFEYAMWFWMNTIKLSGVTVIQRNSFYRPASQNNNINIGYIPEYHRDCATYGFVHLCHLNENDNCMTWPGDCSYFNDLTEKLLKPGFSRCIENYSFVSQRIDDWSCTVSSIVSGNTTPSRAHLRGNNILKYVQIRSGRLTSKSTSIVVSFNH